MKKESWNNNLKQAKKSKNDEFYTQLSDIEKELWHYKEYLKGKITRKDLEKRMLEKTLEHEYAKPHSGEPFKINE